MGTAQTLARPYPHLLLQAQAAAALPAEERCRLIQHERWIGYSRAQEALRELDRLLHYPRRDRMPNMLLFGPTNNGKTKIVRKFAALHPPRNKDEQRRIPVVLVEMSPQPGLTRIYRALLDAIGAVYGSSSHVDKLEPLALRLLKAVDVQIIIIDEVHNLLACNALQQRQVLNLLKYLGNQLKVPIVAVGTEEAWSAIKSDPQMANRFDPFSLPLWTEGDEFLQLMMSFGRSLPLRKPSELANERIMKRVLAQTDGSIGAITRLIEAAAITAIERGDERLTLDGFSVIA